MEEMNPRVRIRLGHAKALPLHCLTEVLFHVRQQKEAFVGYGR